MVSPILLLGGVVAAALIARGGKGPATPSPVPSPAPPAPPAPAPAPAPTTLGMKPAPAPAPAPWAPGGAGAYGAEVGKEQGQVPMATQIARAELCAELARRGLVSVAPDGSCSGMLTDAQVRSAAAAVPGSQSWTTF